MLGVSAFRKALLDSPMDLSLLLLPFVEPTPEERPQRRVWGLGFRV